MNAPLATVNQAASNPQLLTRKAVRNPQLLNEIIDGLNAHAAPVKFGCAKALRIISDRRPDLLYPRFDSFVRLLDSQNKILQWQAILVLSHLARVDVDNRFAAVFGKYFSPIRGPVMITAANVIQGGGRIARAKPRLADRIAAEMLKVTRARYRTAECRNVAIGHAILALGGFFELIRHPAPVLRFVQRQIKNPRPATRSKAAQFLKRVQSHAYGNPTHRDPDREA